MLKVRAAEAPSQNVKASHWSALIWVKVRNPDKTYKSKWSTCSMLERSDGEVAEGEVWKQQLLVYTQVYFKYLFSF